MALPIALLAFAAACGGKISGEGASSETDGEEPSPETTKKQGVDCFEPEVFSKYASGETLYIPVSIIRYAMGDGSQFEPRSSVLAKFEEMNRAFVPVGIQFYISGFQKIPDSTLFNLDGMRNYNALDFPDFPPLYSGELVFLREGEVRPHFDPTESEELKLFIVDHLGKGKEGGLIGGAAALFHGFAVTKDTTSPVRIHEMGHVFGLRHPFQDFDGFQSRERVDGNNCLTSGDWICDTPADRDPYLEGCRVDSKTCVASRCPQDDNGETITPDVHNFMSYYPNGCQNQFTPDQRSIMRCHAKEYMPNMLREEAAPISIPVKDHITVGCSSEDPPLIQDAVDQVAKGGIIELCEGTYEEKIEIRTEALTLRAREGAKVVLDGGGDRTVVKVLEGANVTLENLTLRGGGRDREIPISGTDVWRVFREAAIQVLDSNLTLRNIFIEENSSYGIYSEQSRIEMEGCVIQSSGQESIGSAGLRAKRSEIRAKDSAFLHNEGKGGAVAIDSTRFECEACRFEGNEGTDFSGSAIHAAYSSTLLLWGGQIENNRNNKGAAVVLKDEEEVTFEGHDVYWGGNEGFDIAIDTDWRHSGFEATYSDLGQSGTVQCSTLSGVCEISSN